ncbi:hypothetical protein SELMODRAFT_411826 [Selaginella moellendorffii]|uniref:Uncharacterized protein n=1 Tax=Selaginella moellendorffii TaxID=88036 RepID=D8RJ56_SELML|nr:hypothetical protein SELMODRAFT_411826 [Selaginella moellendorffii]
MRLQTQKTRQFRVMSLCSRSKLKMEGTPGLNPVLIQSFLERKYNQLNVGGRENLPLVSWIVRRKLGVRACCRRQRSRAMGLDLYAVAADYCTLGLDGEDIEIELAWDPVRRAPRVCVLDFSEALHNDRQGILYKESFYPRPSQELLWATFALHYSDHKFARWVEEIYRGALREFLIT